MTLLPLRRILCLAGAVVGSALHAPLAHAQATVEAHADLRNVLLESPARGGR